MATLAAMLKRKGHDVRGSDQDVYSADERLPRGEASHSCRLRARASPATSIHCRRQRDLARGNPSSRRRWIARSGCCSLPEAIREHFLWGARSIVLAGTHGKTTTTSLTGWLLTHGGVDPSVLVGGIARNLVSTAPATGSVRAATSSSRATSTTARFFDKTAKFLSTCPTSRSSTTSSSITPTSIPTSTP